MKKYSCPTCHTTHFVIRHTERGTRIIYHCKSCRKCFSVNTVWHNHRAMLDDHLDGFSFQKLADKYGVSKPTAWRICHEELQKLPDNNQFTHAYCSRFSSVLVPDGKYIAVNGYDRKIPLLWGIDYFTHDIPVFTLAPSESYQAWGKYFTHFRILSHRPQLVVCDDNRHLKAAARHTFPADRIQTCTNHYKEIIRWELWVRKEETYQEVMNRLEAVFNQKRIDTDMESKLFALYRDYRADPVVTTLLTSLQMNWGEFVAYRGIPQAPLTTNLIECYNSHLESRLFALKGFESFSHAKLWLNGYILKRRFTKLTGCTGRFRHLNGFVSVERTKKEGIVLPTLF